MKLYGNAKTHQSFREEFYSGKLSHAFIIEGPRGSGRLTLARHFAKLLVCENKKDACGVCASCLRVDEGTHPDVYEILHKSRTAQIKIDDVREIISRAHIKPSEAEYKVFIIENAQMMNTAAQNALLQIFEEPPKNTLFFLLSTDRNLLLKTLLSRARVLKTELLPDETVEKILTERFPEKGGLIKKAVLLAGGCVGEAVEFLEEEASSDALLLAEQYLSLASNGATLYSLSKVLSPFKKTEREEFSSFCSYLLAAMRDVACAPVGYDTRRMFFQDSDTPRRLADLLGQEKIFKTAEACQNILNKSATVGIPIAIVHINTFFASDIK